MPVAGGPKITKTGILLEVDAADKLSYPGTGTTWINPVTLGTYNGTLNNISFDSNDSKGALIFTGSNTYVDFGNVGDLSSAWSFQVAFKPAATASGEPYTVLSYASGSDTGSITFKLDYSSSTQEVVLSTFSATGSNQVNYAISGSATVGSWNIINGTYGSQVLALFKGGNLVTSVPTTGSTVGYNASNRLYLGGTYGVDSGFYTGSISKLTVNQADLDVRAVTTNFNAFFSRFGLSKTPGLVTDLDAVAFIESSGITNETQLTAINNLVIGLKSNNLWDKMQAVYPFVGGTAYSHKFNLKNPGNTDNAFRIQYVGALNHTAIGVQTAGGYMNTFFDSTDITPPSSSFHYSVYTYTTGSALFNEIFNNSPSSFQDITFTPAYYGGSGHFSLFQNVADFGNNTGINSVGYSVISRLDTTKSTLYRYWANGNYVQDNTSVFSRTSNFSFDILRSVSYTNYTGIINFVTFGAGLTSQESTALNTLVRNFNIALSRNVV